MTASASACAKIILCGEHAVVYGQPAIALPLSDVRVIASATDGQALTFVLQDLNESFDITHSHPIADLATRVCAALDVSPPPVEIRITSQIPIASGLGSGAAIATAVARLLCHIYQREPDPDFLNPLIYESEKQFHGTPSGIDNTVIVYEQPVYFVRGKAIERLDVKGAYTFLIGDTGVRAPTHIPVGDVRRLYESNPEKITPVLEEIGQISHTIGQNLAKGEIKDIGRLMIENHQLLQILTVSSPELDTLVTAALNAGALGAKMSGGGRGGNMIALVDSDTKEAVKNALVQVGAVHVLETTLHGN
jgi:mevalonate kinase